MGKEKNITTDFEEFSKRNDNLSDDITVLSKLDDGSYDKMKGSFEIEKIIDIIKDPEEIKKLEESVSGYPVSTDLSMKDIKRGDVIWLTALLRRPHSTTTFNQSTMGVIQCRIIDFFYGLNKLKDVIK